MSCWHSSHERKVFLMRHHDWWQSISQFRHKGERELSTPGPEQSEPLRCRLEQDAVDEATHQIDNWVMILEPRLDALLECLSGEPSADLTPSATSQWRGAKANPKAFAIKAALHQLKTGIQALKQQIVKAD